MRLLLSLILLLPNASVLADIYRHVDSRGQVSYTDKPPHDGFIKIKNSWKGWQVAHRSGDYKRNKKRYQQYIVTACERYKVSEPLVQAIIHAESYYNPVALSSAGAVGLMQLMPATAVRFGVYDRQDPEQNINGGVRYFSELLEMFDDDVSLSLAAYNAGENAVKRYGRIPPYPETQNYVRKVLALNIRYQRKEL
tara:strand:+ start:4478 stop:5062 length:585 start_codon:yes stop_codon:yes gene_type:complete